MTTRTRQAGGLTFTFYNPNTEAETAKMVSDVVKAAGTNKLLGLAKQFEAELEQQLAQKEIA